MNALLIQHEIQEKRHVEAQCQHILPAAGRIVQTMPICAVVTFKTIVGRCTGIWPTRDAYTLRCRV